MPLIKTIDSIKIYVYLRDHLPPHFHVLYSEFEELVEIRTLKTYSGYVPTRQRRRVIAWAEKNKDFIMKKWLEFNPA
jgi:hypothetical protein